MLLKVCLLISLVAVSESADSSYITPPPGTPCGIPIDPPGQAVVDTISEVGVWYEYYFFTPGLDEANCVTNYTYFGQDEDPRGPGQSSLYNQTTTFYLIPGLGCFGVYGLLNFTTNGKRYSTFYLPLQPEPQPVVFTVFHADRDWEFFYYCGQENATTGICDVPNLFVKTRLFPTDLSEYLQTSIKAKINEILKPWCMSLADLNLYRLNSTVPPQCLTTPPAGFTALVDSGLQWVIKP